ncbi:Cupin domain-containing protein [Jezberella montanilacus]|uniref:Cupin domain-containing protein n=1 Tax=Jezberella montanilacus TaxID=323426 RepID=A0A2T0XG65_9BURK|nr:Cupin domain-containing protein [Jezberella montanilacus]
MSKISLVDSLKSLSDDHSLFRKFFSHGLLEIELYKPEGVDLQKPHDRDEIYVVASGSSHFTVGAKEYDAVVGDVLFVAAGIEHRFSQFSDDFATWVFFYGPEGGECPQVD